MILFTCAQPWDWFMCCRDTFYIFLLDKAAVLWLWLGSILKWFPVTGGLFMKAGRVFRLTQSAIVTPETSKQYFNPVYLCILMQRKAHGQLQKHISSNKRELVEVTDLFWSQKGKRTIKKFLSFSFLNRIIIGIHTALSHHKDPIGASVFPSNQIHLANLW